MRPTIFMITFVTLLVGCVANPVSTQSAPKISAVAESGRSDFIMAVVSAHTHLDGVIDGTHWRGVYGGKSARGCSRVRLNLVDRPHHKWHYLICGREVLEILGVAPEPPRNKQIIVILDSLTKAAWRTGRVQRLPYEAYELEAEPAGPPSFGGCRIVEQRLLYQDMLIDLKDERMCGGHG